MALTCALFAAGAVAVLFAGHSRGGSGCGAAFAGAAILPVVVPPGTAPGALRC